MPYDGIRIDEHGLTKPRILCAGLAFLLSFVFLLLIGYAGPEIWQEVDYETSAPITLTTGNTEYYFVNHGVVKENQMFYVESRIAYPQLEGVMDGSVSEAELGMTLSVTDSNGDEVLPPLAIERDMECEPGEDWCSWYFLMSQEFINSDTYYIDVGIDSASWTLDTGEIVPGNTTAVFKVQTRVTQVQAQYTKFEMAWKYLFLLGTTFAMFLPRIGYVNRYLRLHSSDRSFEQSFTLALLCLLWWFNDPLFIFTIYVGGQVSLAISGFYIICVVVFIAALLFWWLCVFDLARKTSSDMRGSGRGMGDTIGGRNSCCFYGPKLLLVFAIALVNMGAYFYYRYSTVIKPEYTGVADTGGAGESYAGLIGFLMAIYMLLLIFYLIMSCGNIMRLPLAHQMLHSASAVTVFICIVGIFTASFYPWDSARATFVGFYGLYNMYCWALSWCFAPRFSIGEGAEAEMTGALSPQSYPQNNNPVVTISSSRRSNDFHNI